MAELSGVLSHERVTVPLLKGSNYLFFLWIEKSNGINSFLSFSCLGRLTTNS